MKEQINKIKWVEINPEDESTFPVKIEQDLILSGYYLDDENKIEKTLLLTFCPVIFLVKKYHDFLSDNELKYVVCEIGVKKQFKLKKWAIVDLGNNDYE